MQFLKILKHTFTYRVIVIVIFISIILIVLIVLIVLRYRPFNTSVIVLSNKLNSQIYCSDY